jgi:hypothetical protein
MDAIRGQAQTSILEEQLQLSVRERASARSCRVAVASGLVFFLPVRPDPEPVATTDF